MLLEMADEILRKDRQRIKKYDQGGNEDEEKAKDEPLVVAGVNGRTPLPADYSFNEL